MSQRIMRGQDFPFNVGCSGGRGSSCNVHRNSEHLPKMSFIVRRGSEDVPKISSNVRRGSEDVPKSSSYECRNSEDVEWEGPKGTTKGRAI